MNPPPAGLWSASPASVPPSGNYVRMESEPGDWAGSGVKATYTQANSIITIDADNSVLGIGVMGDMNWSALFRAMVPLSQMEPGYYAVANSASPVNNPTRASMSVGGGGHSCSFTEGWFVIDSITYANGEPIAIDLRFQQKCDASLGVLRGQVHWRSDDPTVPPGPAAPPPNLWAPDPNAVPATGNFVYLESEPGDFIAQGLVKLYTPLDSIITAGGGGMTPVANRFQLTVAAEEEWTGYFQAMNTLPQLQPGYYGNLLGFPHHNPVTGGLSWSGECRGCNEAQGWFVIDEVTYSGSSLDSIDLRFEQLCDFSTGKCAVACAGLRRTPEGRPGPRCRLRCSGTPRPAQRPQAVSTTSISRANPASSSGKAGRISTPRATRSFQRT